MPHRGGSACQDAASLCRQLVPACFPAKNYQRGAVGAVAGQKQHGFDGIDGGPAFRERGKGRRAACLDENEERFAPVSRDGGRRGPVDAQQFGFRCAG